MNVLHLALTNIRALRRRLYPLIALLAVTGAVGLGALGIAEHAQGTTDQRIEESTANRSITVDRPEPGTSTPELTDSAAAGLARLPHVTLVQHRAQISIALAPPGATALLYATTHRPAVTPPITKSVRAALFPLHPGEIVAPATADGVDLTHLVGRTIDVETIRFVRPGEGTGVPDRARLAAVYDPTWQLDGPDAAYAADATVIRWAARRAGVPEGTYPRTIGYDQLTVVTDTAAHTPDVMKSSRPSATPPPRSASNSRRCPQCWNSSGRPATLCWPCSASSPSREPPR
ncbi:hypothetical protein [Streptomyces roseirectus]|uniref:hypothetical protein n=1 Tax=Streptomyces roseirectus TaxID=2768066 RepID=UPI001FE2F4A6|nr:hypothetical protein [Streptomyces roseirectus]